jgi:hypothetical protein
MANDGDHPPKFGPALVNKLVDDDRRPKKRGPALSIICFAAIA